MEVWKIIFLSKWVICRFHVNLPGCMIMIKRVVSCVGCVPIIRARSDVSKDIMQFCRDLAESLLAEKRSRKIRRFADGSLKTQVHSLKLT